MHASVRYRFGNFVLDVAERSLTRCDPPAVAGGISPQPVRVSLQPKTFELLAHLVTHPNKLHTKQALLDAVWGKVVVTESSLTRGIHHLRTALDDTAELPVFVETIPRVGYRFIAPVTCEEQLATPAADPLALPRSTPAPSSRVFAYALLAVLGIVASYFLFDKVYLQGSAAIARTMPSVAVLPFKSIGDDPGTEALADGVPGHATDHARADSRTARDRAHLILLVQGRR